jgi:hypothetical protein
MGIIWITDKIYSLIKRPAFSGSFYKLRYACIQNELFHFYFQKLSRITFFIPYKFLRSSFK